MKRRFSDLLRKSGLAALVLAGALALSAPGTVLAARGGGGHGGFSGGGHSFSAGRGFGGGQHFSAPAPAYRGGGYRGYGYGGRGYYRPGFGYGYGYGYAAPYFGYGYTAPACGYYDSWGRWIPTGCYTAPYPYTPGY